MTPHRKRTRARHALSKTREELRCSPILQNELSVNGVLSSGERVGDVEHGEVGLEDRPIRRCQSPELGRKRRMGREPLATGLLIVHALLAGLMHLAASLQKTQPVLFP